MSALRPDQILKVLDLADSFNLHREKITIPLITAEKRVVDVLADGRLRITCSAEASFDAWFSELREILRKMDLSKLGTP